MRLWFDVGVARNIKDAEGINRHKISFLALMQVLQGSVYIDNGNVITGNVNDEKGLEYVKDEFKDENVLNSKINEFKLYSESDYFSRMLHSPFTFL